MTAAGYSVHFTTIARWKAQGWQHTINDVHPLDLAGGKLESIAPLATGNPTAVIGEGAGDKSSNISQNARTCQMQSFSAEKHENFAFHR